jgi:anti-anti-sigma regulatory factor
MNTLQQINSSSQALLNMPIESGLKYSKRAFKAINPDINVIEIDMSAQNQLNARDLGKLLRLQKMIQDQGKHMKLVNVSLRVIMFLELTQANAIFDITMNHNLNSDFAA